MEQRLILLFLGTVLMYTSGSCQNTLTQRSPINPIAEQTIISEMQIVDEVEKNGNHERAEDYTWDVSKIVPVSLNGNTITIGSSGGTIKGSVITITSAGTYILSGKLADGQVIVNTKDKETVRLILNGVDIACSTNSPINIVEAKKTIIVLNEGTKNNIADGTSYVANDDGSNAAIYSKSDLTIFGKGGLNVAGNFNDGITGKDGLIIKSGTISVKAVDDGIIGKDYLIIRNGDITVNAQGDGLKSDNIENKGRGFIRIDYAKLNITSGGDAMSAETDIEITDGLFDLQSGVANGGAVSIITSMKGIKATDSLTIIDGTYKIIAADDALNSNNLLQIDGGKFTISTGDDGIHADTALIINGGTISITESYEGIESASITINSGNIHLVSADDGINAAGGNSGAGGGGQFQGGPGRGRGGFGGGYGGGGGNYFLYINGGYLSVKSSGDGLDCNGSAVMTGGTVIVDGPTSSGNGAVDYDGSFKITGGFLLAAGSSRMAQIPDGTSTQASVLLTFNSLVSSGTIINLQTTVGKELFTYINSRDYQSLAFSSPDLKIGTNYDVYLLGKSTGKAVDGLFTGGVYNSGTKSKSFTASSVATVVY